MRAQFKERLIEASIWALWWLLIGSATVWILVGSAGWWVRLGWVDAQAASWAQALGSILAVAVAVAVPWFQVVRNRRERQEEIQRARLSSIKSMYAIISRLKNLFEQLAEKPDLIGKDPGGLVTSLSVELEEAALMVKEMQLSQVESEYAFLLIGAKEVAAYALFLLRQPRQFGVTATAIAIATRLKAKANVKTMDEWLKMLDEHEAKLLAG